MSLVNKQKEIYAHEGGRNVTVETIKMAGALGPDV